jgi:hypothetical protein
VRFTPAIGYFLRGGIKPAFAKKYFLGGIFLSAVQYLLLRLSLRFF